MTGDHALQKTSGRRHFALMDSLRAIAVIMVLLSHVLGSTRVVEGGARNVAGTLGSGVMIFFVVSGFLMYRPFVAARYQGKPLPDVGIYARRRFLRIVPAYWVALTLLAIKPGLPGVFTGDFYVFYGFMQGYGLTRYVGLFVAWSLAVEVAFYIFLPLYASLVKRVARRPDDLLPDVIALSLFMAYALFSRWWLGNSGYRPSGITYGLFPHMDGFVPGMALAILSVRFEQREKASPLVRFVARRSAVCWGVAVGAFFAVTVAFNRIGASSGFEELMRAILIAIMATLIVVPAVLGETEGGLPRRMMANRSLLWIGTVSYGIYLWHYPLAFQVVKVTRNPLGASVLLMIVATIMAALSWYALERPLIEWGRSREGRAGRRRAAIQQALADDRAAP